MPAPSLSPAILLLSAASITAAGNAAPGAPSVTSTAIDLENPTGRNVGFSRLPPGTTGITFVNELSEEEIATNRVLANGSGVAIGDYDGDGLADLFFCGLASRSTLYRNLGNWRFEDVTDKAGLDLPAGYHRAAVFADIDGDGDPDLLVGTLDRGVLCFRNEGSGTFDDITEEAGTSDDSASTTLALADVDGNGTLDLYVVNNRPDDIRDRGELNLKVRNNEVLIPPDLKGRIDYAFGQVIEYGQEDRLLLNDGNGRFHAASWTDGTFLDTNGRPLDEAPRDWGLTGTFRDINGDALPDIYVCNDYWTPDRIWINKGGGVFQAMGPDKVSKFSASSMGVDFADVNADGITDFLALDMLSRDVRARKRQRPAGMPPAGFLATASDRPQVMRNTFFAGNDDGRFQEIGWYAGLAASEWSWSPIFTDVDLDGRVDLLISAGHYKDVQDVDAGLQISRRQGGRKGITDPGARQRAFIREKMENSRLYPPLDAPIIAFKNLGGFRFKDITGEWGTGDPGVHHGIALGDLDGDGDPDLVANNLNGTAGVFRNDAGADRIAIRLKGLAPNTQAAGAGVTLRSDGLPVQHREVVIGGHYTSASDTQLCFAASSNMTAEVRWPGGGRSFIRDLSQNRIYAIVQPTRADPPDGKTAGKHMPLFTEVPVSGEWTHAEATFDDYAVQPLLPFKLSHQGPGVGWIIDPASDETRLLVGGGRGGTPGLVRFEDGKAEGVPLEAAKPLEDDTAGIATPENGNLLMGVTSYENDAAGGVIAISGPSRLSTIAGFEGGAGAIAIADVDGDGRLEAAIAPSAEPGRYPGAGPVRVLHRTRGEWRGDKRLRINLSPGQFPNGMIFSDLDGDARPELIIACEWGPLRVYAFERGAMVDTTANWGLDQWTGLWKGVSVGDFNGDGRMDIIASNWGTNSPLQTRDGKPLVLAYGELAVPGLTDLIETDRLPGGELTVARSLAEIATAMPYLLARFSSFKQFADAPLEEALGDRAVLSRQTSVRTLAATVFLNKGSHFEPRPLPREAQMAPGFGVAVADFDGDGNDDVFLAQNFSHVRMGWDPVNEGRGLLLKGDGTGGFRALASTESGINIAGDQRGAAVGDFDHDGRTDLAVGVNEGRPAVFRNQSALPGLSLILQGSPENPLGIGAVVRAMTNGREGRAHEIHAGSGYWSQDSPRITLRGEDSDQISAVNVRWPDGSSQIVRLSDVGTVLKVRKH